MFAGNRIEDCGGRSSFSSILALWGVRGNSRGLSQERAGSRGTDKVFTLPVSRLNGVDAALLKSAAAIAPSKRRDEDKRPVYQPPDNIWPEELDVVPTWRLDAEARALLTGAELVWYRTKREFLQAHEEAEAIHALICPLTTVLETVSETPYPEMPKGPHATQESFTEPCLPKLVPMKGSAVGRVMDPEGEAKRFLAWLIETHRIGPWSSEEMSDFYRIFCRDNARSPIPENVLRAALKPLKPVKGRPEGASKGEHDLRVNGKRIRTVVWTITGTAPMKVKKPNERAQVQRQRRAA